LASEDMARVQTPVSNFKIDMIRMLRQRPLSMTRVV